MLDLGDCLHSTGEIESLANLKRTHFVIFVSPSQHIAPGSCYIAQDGSPTMMSSRAVRSTSFAQAKEFAEANLITLNRLTYIGREDFTDLGKTG